MNYKHKKQLLFLAILIVIIVLPMTTDALKLNVEKYPEIGGVNLGCIETGECELSVGIIVIFIYNAAIWIGGIVAFVYLVYAGFLYIFSGNAPGNRSKATGMITNIVWGVGILLLSYIILVLVNPDLVNLPEESLTTIIEGDTDFNIGEIENRLSGCDTFNENMSTCIADNYPNVQSCTSCCFAKSDAAGKQACQTSFLDTFIPTCFQKYESSPDPSVKASALTFCQSDCVEGLVAGISPTNACSFAISKYIGENQPEGNPGIDPTEYSTLLNICNTIGNSVVIDITEINNQRYLECKFGSEQIANDWCASCTDTFEGQKCFGSNPADGLNTGNRACGYVDNF